MNPIQKLAVKFVRFQIRRAQNGALFPVIALLLAIYNCVKVILYPEQLQTFNFALSILCFLAALASFYDLGLRLLMERDQLHIAQSED